VATEFQDAAGISHLAGAGPSLIWASADEVARAAVEGVERGKRVVMPRLNDKVQGVFGRYSPRSVLLPVMRRFGDRILPH
jgi:short-subunit dehydrogenase